ncbi:bifunctional RNase H/acid phosphatase [Mobilicoccus caccae]|uniref:Bifunctional RNase H/acid phosphatase n=1 Tax=Mobilicoccus caccae TaxID=1859295 RepID=A0ABQ6IN81_9MICO|nr:bifunctional RNase H/acid phosphatase [Mobilicoccus caccae]GMA39370.1 bifunctional RNase H/acid phosphatase [Mobilicoccus caccae]
MRRLVVEADGGSRGNPGVAGYGALVRDADGVVVRELAAPLGKASNNVAEYTGLIVGLRAALEVGEGDPIDVEARMDSKLVVEQMSGRWKIKHADMQRLAQEARAIVAEVKAAGGSVRFTWIPRAQNSAADALSNEGMDGHTVDRSPAGGAFPDPGVEGEEDEALVPPPAPLPRTSAGPDLSPPVRVVLVRHGVTEFTRQGRLDGRGGADPALTPEGMAQARAAARGVRDFLGETAQVRVVTSSLQRAHQSGQVIAAALGVHAEVEEDLDELCFGAWEGRTVAEISREDAQALQRSRSEDDVPPPGGESYAQLGQRVRPVFARLVEEARESAGDAGSPAVVVVAHRGPIGVILAEALGMALPNVWRLATTPGALTSLRLWRDGGIVVEFVNDTSHLR